MDGLTERGQSDGLGYGWNIDTAEIYWSKVRFNPLYGNVHLVWDPSLMMSLNGKVVRLIPDANGVPAENQSLDCWQYTLAGKATTAFRLEDGSMGRVAWKGTTVADEWWEVTTTDGVVYAFGSSPDSRVMTRAAGWSFWGQYAGNCDASYGEKATRWRLKQITYPSGQAVTYSYWKQTFAEQCDVWYAHQVWNPGWWASPDSVEMWLRASELARSAPVPHPVRLAFACELHPI